MTEPREPYASYSPRRTEALRGWGDILLIWTLCERRRCAHARACRGDARICVPRYFPHLPEGVQAWFAGLGQAQAEGDTFDEALEWVDSIGAAEAFQEWHAAQSERGRDERSEIRNGSRRT